MSAELKSRKKKATSRAPTRCDGRAWSQNLLNSDGQTGTLGLTPTKGKQTSLQALQGGQSLLKLGHT